MTRHAWIFALLLGCGTDGPNVEGSWAGDWMAPGGTGNLAFELQQSDDAVTGTVTFTGSPCFTMGGVTGTVHDSEFFGTISAGALRIDFDSTITDSSLDGTLTAIAAGGCSGSTGSFVVTP
jgi:hypothetical protein